MRPKPIVCALLIAGLMLGLNSGALAQDYPNRQVKIIIAFSPSGAIDILGRFIADKLSKLWGQSVIVENRPAAAATSERPRPPRRRQTATRCISAHKRCRSI